METLSAAYTLPCGLTLANRTVKAAMAEDLAKHGQPNDKHLNLYRAWSDGDWGMLLTGNVQVDANHLGSVGDVSPGTLGDEQKYQQTLELWKEYASAAQSHGTPALMQISHPGRQTPFISRRGQALAPSAVRLDLGSALLPRLISRFVFGTPKAMTSDDIKLVIEQFASAAKLAAAAGFKGVQLHGAHGYLISSFLSPLSNVRTDDYGGTPIKRARFLKDIIEAVRAAVPKGFCVGVKINSADHQQEGGLQDSLDQIELIHELVDFIEISGGSYEKPRMITGDKEENTPGGEAKPTARTALREAFFLQYAKEVRTRFPSVPLLVTGGFRSRLGLQAALEDGACDLVGIGRPACVELKMPREIIFNADLVDEKAKVELAPLSVPWIARVLGVASLTAGLVTVTYQSILKKVAAVV